MPSKQQFPVCVILERRPATSVWIDYVWSAVGITVGRHDNLPAGQPVRIHEEDGVERYIVTGLEVSLHVDQCESYYHNMMTRSPRCFVIAHYDQSNPDDFPRPFRVSMSFDEAHAYYEGEEEVYSVDIPPELYRWTEAFVINHYVAEKRSKRKLVDWKQSADSGSAS
ncbi:MAG: DUF3305 domain-containing protein [Gammaproteobacteria bacterium]|jgi:hypothetical protein